MNCWRHHWTDKVGWRLKLKRSKQSAIWRHQVGCIYKDHPLDWSFVFAALFTGGGCDGDLLEDDEVGGGKKRGGRRRRRRGHHCLHLDPQSSRVVSSLMWSAKYKSIRGTHCYSVCLWCHRQEDDWFASRSASSSSPVCTQFALVEDDPFGGTQSTNTTALMFAHHSPICGYTQAKFLDQPLTAKERTMEAEGQHRRPLGPVWGNWK